MVPYFCTRPCLIADRKLHISPTWFDKGAWVFKWLEWQLRLADIVNMTLFSFYSRRVRFLPASLKVRGLSSQGFLVKD